jgi:hypothetical protein
LQSLASQTPPDPALPSTRDAHGYSLLHAAASYGHLDLIRALVQTYHVDPNIADEDGDTPLFYAESLEVAHCLVDELGADTGKRNAEGMNAEDKIAEEAEGSWVPAVLEYLRNKTGRFAAVVNGASAAETVSPLIARPGMAPDNVQIEFGTMQELPEGDADPEIRRRIEELASKGDLESEDVQRELRALVTDVVSGLREDAAREPQRRRVEE